MNYKQETSLFGIKNPETSLPSDTIKLALGHSSKYLNLIEFMDVINFKKDPIMTDFFWQIMVNEQGCHLTALLLEMLGYEGEFKNQQTCFKIS